MQLFSFTVRRAFPQLEHSRNIWNSLRRLWPSSSDLEIESVTLFESTAKSSSGTTIKSWRSVSDSLYQGRSSCHVEVQDDGVHFSGEVKPPEIVEGREGSISRGFCAIRGATPSVVDLRDHQCVSYFKDDLYQLAVTFKQGVTVLTIPFTAFLLTARGRYREQQRSNDFLQCEGLGFLVTETERPFHLIIESIIAIPVVDEKMAKEFKKFEQQQEPFVTA